MNKLIKKIEEVKSTHHMDNSDLSRALGYADHYITRVLREGRSTATQERLVAEIDTWLSNLNADSTEYVLKAYHDQEMHKYLMETIEIEKVSDARWEENQKLKLDLKLVHADIEVLNKVLEEERKFWSFYAEKADGLERKLSKKAAHLKLSYSLITALIVFFTLYIISTL